MLKVTSDGCTDVAGNTAQGIDSANFKVDTSTPSISDQGPTTQPDAAGWYNTDVTNTFKATDSSGSGLSAACLASFPLNAGGDNVQSKTTSGEGLTQKVSSDSCTDVAGNSSVGVDSATFQVDKTPIPSTASANNSSNSSPITVNYDASTDPADLSGLKKVELWAKGPGQSSYANVEQATAATGSFSYAVTQEGTYSFYTIAEDNAGNREVAPPGADAIVTFTQDSAAPTTTASAKTADNSTYLSGEWTNQNVTVSLSAADNTGGSGLKEIRYTSDGTDPSASSTLYSGPFTVSSTTTVKYRAYDNVGNVEAIKTFEVKIDKAAPSTSCSVTPSKLNPASNNHKLLTITASVSVTDTTGGSGANGFTLVSVTSNQAGSGLGKDDVANDIQGWAIGTPDLTGQLRAERYGTERIYTLTYRGKDLAGNTTDCLATVRVPKGK